MFQLRDPYVPRIGRLRSSSSPPRGCSLCLRGPGLGLYAGGGPVVGHALRRRFAERVDRAAAGEALAGAVVEPRRELLAGRLALRPVRMDRGENASERVLEREVVPKALNVVVDVAIPRRPRRGEAVYVEESRRWERRVAGVWRGAHDPRELQLVDEAADVGAQSAHNAVCARQQENFGRDDCRVAARRAVAPARSHADVKARRLQDEAPPDLALPVPRIIHPANGFPSGHRSPRRRPGRRS
mmetsp:Transcript_15961/g.54480  ORF Transcript_15961/g.54480 Transcript_15961/m.54480 type:complete len:242 (+) Transcript_15961:22-747(+)